MIKRCIKTLLLLILIVFLSTITSFAQQQQNGRNLDVKIYFHYDEAFIDSSYMGNGHTLLLVDSLLKDSEYISTLRRIEVTAQSSPEGSVSYNDRLSERRRKSLERYFTAKYPEINPSLWSFRAVAENWDLFHEDLANDKNLPNRQEVLGISLSDREPDQKEWLLRTLYGGKPWKYIKENILPSHRFGASMLFIPLENISIIAPQPLKSRAIFEQPTTYIPPIKSLKAIEVLFAIKSNLVLDALSVINLGVEIPIGKRISVVGEVVYPWWRSWPADFTMQIESYHGEVKYWLGNRDIQKHLQGFSVGVYGGWGRYDIQPFSRTGVQGEFIDFGAEVGYAHEIAKNMHLEYTVGVGYVSTTYDNYKMVNNTEEFGDIKVIPYPWIKNRLNSVLPTRCGVSLVWTIKAKGGRR